eukprot:COSAG01_NODE_5899_length_3964_cov_3.056404_5_plen_101_part_00
MEQTESHGIQAVSTQRIWRMPLSLSRSLALSLAGGCAAALPHGALSALQLLPQPPHRRRPRPRLGLGLRLGLLGGLLVKQSAALVPRGATCESGAPTSLL